MVALIALVSNIGNIGLLGVLNGLRRRIGDGNYNVYSGPLHKTLCKIASCAHEHSTMSISTLFVKPFILII